MKNIIAVLTFIATLGLAAVTYADNNTDATSSDNAPSQAQPASFADDESNANDEPASFKDVVYSLIALDETDNDNEVTQLIDEEEAYSSDALLNQNNITAQLIDDSSSQNNDNSNSSGDSQNSSATPDRSNI